MGPRAKSSKGKAQPKRSPARKPPKGEGARVRDLEKRLTESLEREKSKDRALTEALGQQTATAEVLKVISRSTFELPPVLDTLIENAARLCGARRGVIFRRDSNNYHGVAFYNTSPETIGFVRAHPISPGRHTITARVALERRTIHVVDVQADPEYGYVLRDEEPIRTELGVPMFRGDEILGVIVLFKVVVEPFTDKQIELVETFADQAVIAIENVRLFKELEARKRELTESLDQQTATSEILRVISTSPTDLRPVLDAVVRSAARFCGADDAELLRLDGEYLAVAAHHGPIPTPVGRLIPVVQGSVSGRAFAERRAIHVADLEAEAKEFPVTSGLAREFGFRTSLSVPLLREGMAVGTITLRRAEVSRFTDKQIKLLETFADQAVIAIENVRLFTELEGRNRDLTATSEILRVISQSPRDAHPVFDAIVRSAVKLSGGLFGALFRFDGELLHLVAHHNYSLEALEEVRRVFPTHPTRAFGMGRAILERTSVLIPDVEVDLEYQQQALSRAIGWRSGMFVPMMRDGTPIGGIMVTRAKSGPFSGNEVSLLKTFADQAVIAIENVRLFTELQTSNRDLTKALDTQTATADILGVISRSQTDVQPVFDAILGSAVRLLRGHTGALTRIAGDQIELAALVTPDDASAAVGRARFPRPLASANAHAFAIRRRRPINIADALNDPGLPEDTRAFARTGGFRSVMAVPMLRHDEAIGSIAVSRREVNAFTDDEIALLQTFADQAVIAIENARLFSELQVRTQELTRSVEQLTALGDVGRAVSSSLDLDTVLTTIVGRAVQLSGTDGGTIFEYDESAEEFTARATLTADEGQSAVVRATRLRRGEGAVGQMAVTRESLQIPDIAAEGAYESRIRGGMLAAGTRSVLAVPLLHEEQLVGGLVVTRRVPGAFTAEVVELLRTFATQSALAIQNARLFHEIADKSAQLEAASRHKSEFLANMSHELRTPLNAIIGFSEVLSERMFGELNDKQAEYLKDIYASGQHLLSLINDILDLSKIEAGRMELEAADFDLPSAIDNALTLVRERATRRGITLGRTIDDRLVMLRGDERKVKQVLLNLLSNALKFTSEGGRIDVSVHLQEGAAEIAVTDTGVGIAPEDQEAIFEEFRQVGTADKKVEGTGLGLALSRKFIELHGGRIWVMSEVGHGSTFTFTLPVRHGA